MSSLGLVLFVLDYQLGIGGVSISDLIEILKSDSKNNMKEPKIIEKFADNGEHSHYELMDIDTGKILWSEDEDLFNMSSMNFTLREVEEPTDFCVQHKSGYCDDCPIASVNLKQSDGKYWKPCSHQQFSK